MIPLDEIQVVSVSEHIGVYVIANAVPYQLYQSHSEVDQQLIALFHEHFPELYTWLRLNQNEDDWWLECSPSQVLSLWIENSVLVQAFNQVWISDPPTFYDEP